jgi:hypothetical protein
MKVDIKAVFKFCVISLWRYVYFVNHRETSPHGLHWNAYINGSSRSAMMLKFNEVHCLQKCGISHISQKKTGKESELLFNLK